MLFFNAPLAYAQTVDDATQNQIDETTAKINQLQQEIYKLQTELNATSKQKQTLQSAVDALNLNIQKLQKSISLTQTQISQKDAQIRKLSTGIASTSSEIGQTREGVAVSLRELAQHDDEPLGVMLLGGGTLSSFFDEAATLEAMRSSLQNKVQDLNSLKSTLQTTKSSTEQKRTELAALKQNLSDQQKGLTVAKAEQTKLLEDTKNKESNYQTLIAQKKEEQKHFEAELFELSSKLGSANASDIPSARSGILHWPLDQVFITQQFGKTSSSGRLYASGTHDGMDFRAAIGTPVRAALGGTVEEVNQGAVKNCQYGKWVLVRHSNGLSTLYAHLSSISVAKGQSVSTGQVVGFAGDTGYATGPHLHFTVYLAEAVTFKQYTCKSGKAVMIPIAPTNAYLNPLAYLPAL